MDDETIVELLITAELRAPCADVRARCELVAQVHKFWIDILHTEGRTEDRRIVSWRTLVETSREAQVAGLALWLSQLHARAHHMGPATTSDGSGRRGAYRAAIDAGSPADAPRGDDIVALDDGLSDGGSARDRIGSGRPN